MERLYLHAATGFALVELLLAAAIFGLLVTGVTGAIAYGQTATVISGDRARALDLADEGIQAVRNIGDTAYTSLADGTYGLAQSSDVWTLWGNSDTTGIFTRQIVIVSNGANRKVVTVTVSWKEASGSTTEVKDTVELSNWMASPIARAWVNVPRRIQSAGNEGVSA
jgi:hypothetical protein